MIGRMVALGAVLLTALLVQTVLLSHLSLLGWRPDLVLVTVVALALADGAHSGMRYGFVAGLAVDLLSGPGLVGLSSLVYLLVGYVTGVLRPYVSGTVLAGQVAVAGIAGSLAVLTYGVVAMLLHVAQYRPSSVLVGALAIGVYDALLAPLVCRPVQLLTERFETGAPAAPRV